MSVRAVLAAALAGVLAATALVVVPDQRRYGQGCPRSGDDTIVMATGEDLNPGRRRQELVRRWNEGHPDGPQARLVEIPGGTNAEHAQMLAAQQAGSCAYDVLSLDVVWVPEFIDAGLVEPIPAGAFDPSVFLPKAWSTGLDARGRLYAVPFTSNVGLLYYRRDIVGDAPPRTYADLRRLASRANLDRLPAAGAAPLVTQLDDYEGLTVNAMEAIWAAGGALTVQGERLHLDDAGARGLTRLLDDARAGVILRASARYQEATSMQAFAEGHALFLRNWPYAFPVLKTDPHLRNRFGVAELPTDGPGPHRGALGGQNLAVSKHARDKRQARDFIAFMTAPPQQQSLYACGGYVPVRKEVYADVRACSDLPGQTATTPEEDTDQVTRDELRALAAVLTRALATAEPRPRVPRYPDFSRALHERLHTALTRSRTFDPSTLSPYLTTCSGWRRPRSDCP
ncbi:extracellular solute-binding protein [Actinomadura flavalba]|uniref:extracellular solute-binding protein n=1 Tax=Actinomadura flavalba TaxID=1120938 RepID=UPI000366BC72|nr:extracellular solute-binding protein [Actinomadura flavalba]